LQSPGDGADLAALDTLPKVGARAGDDPLMASGLAPDERVGPYKLVRPLGAGGMAEVWLAQRADGAFKREVALKLPMMSRLRRDLAQRFAHERDILAGLEHVNIARLYDAGVTPEGLPYLAMEYVPGQPLTAWCDSQRLGVPERIRLFLQVLDAVQYAHARQVIHRDIKPSNILVTETGQVRLLDFGVAKLLAHEDQDRTELTQIYGRALTPDYASPELLRGEAVDAVSDIYSLGVLLYELLSGVRPYKLKTGASITVLEQAILQTQVARPSTQLAPDAGPARGMNQQALARRLAGDLDAIVLKTLCKEPERRYDSAASLADDLQRYLLGQPVRARPDSLLYRAGKFTQRHRTGVVAVVASTLTLVVVVAVAPKRIPLAPTAAPATALAAMNDKSIAVLPFVDMSQAKDQEYFADGMAEELIDHLAGLPDLKVIARTSSFQFKGKNEDVRAIAVKLGVAHLLEGSVRKSGKALRITAQLIRASDGSHLWSKTYERRLDDIFKVQDQIATAVVNSLQVAMGDGALASRGRQPDIEAYNLVLQGNFFKARSNAKDTEKAVALYKKAIDLDPGYALAWARLGSAHFNQAGNAWAPQRESVDKARAELEQALRIDPNLAWAHYSLVGLHMTFDWDWAAAQTEIDRIRRVEPTFSFLPGAEADLAAVQGRLDQAIVSYQRLLDRDPLDTDTLSTLASLQLFAGRFEESAASCRRLIKLNPGFAGAHTQFGMALIQLHQFDAALQSVERESDESYRLSLLPISYWALGRRTASDSTLANFVVRHADDGAYNIAQIYAYRGEADKTFEWLDRAYSQRDPGMVYLKVDPMFRTLAADPRFKAMLVRMRLAD
jgi:TolB-like protein/tRNA A-37 threonylcarbamoyl transferase component Bud32/Tfp pilus assembly protein PilF